MCVGAPCNASAPFSRRRLAEKDRAILERGVRAFVSYIRGYKEHHCKFIFRLSDVDLGRLAYCFGLLRLPRMPEIKRKGRTLAFEPSSVDPETVPFRDKAREKQRRQGEAAREVKREKERQERQAKAAQHAQQAALQKLPSAKRKKLATRQDQHDMEEDYHMLRRIKVSPRVEQSAGDRDATSLVRISLGSCRGASCLVASSPRYGALRAEGENV